MPPSLVGSSDTLPLLLLPPPPPGDDAIRMGVGMGSNPGDAAPPSSIAPASRKPTGVARSVGPLPSSVEAQPSLPTLWMERPDGEALATDAAAGSSPAGAAFRSAAPGESNRGRGDW